MMGFYFMIGSSGGIAGPLIVGAIIGATGSWRQHWMVMAAAIPRARCAVSHRHPRCGKGGKRGASLASASAATERRTSSESPWTVREALRSPAFITLAFADDGDPDGGDDGTFLAGYACCESGRGCCGGSHCHEPASHWPARLPRASPAR